MHSKCRAILILAAFLIPSFRLLAAPVAYIDESIFLADLAALSYVVAHEGFEDDSVWGDYRSGVPGGFNTVGEVTNLGMTWTSNFLAGEITTGTGPARSGLYGFYAIPHGSYATTDPGADCLIPGECGDGWRGRVSEGLIYAIGGWIETNTPFAKIGLFIGEYPDNGMDFGETCDPPESENCFGNAKIGTAPKFFGVIDTQGFDRFEFRDLAGC